jgi:rubrerythrin
MKYQIVSTAPRGASYVQCPSCNLIGWHMDDDPEPMVCPDCLIPAVPYTEEP